MSRLARVALLAAAAAVVACGGSDDEPVVPAPGPNPVRAAPGSLGADGRANVQPDGSAFVVTGGEAADAAHTYTVTTRAQLIAALYGSPSADPGTATPDDTPKRILTARWR
jgi:pectate lyase